ncbi:hypothetical protein VNO77_44101 [Canavalia gladiata]|uniref:Uncharacterized protein n=1 Tax=Canavalia gladiata TaxID=3824 RepID=A0AAN9JVE8_CANGL
MSHNMILGQNDRMQESNTGRSWHSTYRAWDMGMMLRRNWTCGLEWFYVSFTATRACINWNQCHGLEPVSSERSSYMRRIHEEHKRPLISAGTSAGASVETSRMLEGLTLSNSTRTDYKPGTKSSICFCMASWKLTTVQDVRPLIKDTTCVISGPLKVKFMTTQVHS